MNATEYFKKYGIDEAKKAHAMSINLGHEDLELKKLIEDSKGKMDKIDLEEENALIEKIALENGFKLKQQPNGRMALNPYVFDFAEKLLDKKQAEINDLKQKLACYENPDYVLVPRKSNAKLLNALEKGFAWGDDGDGEYNPIIGYKAMIEAVEKDHAEN